MGYVGLPLAHTFAENGLSVTGIDLDAQKVRRINRGQSYIGDVSSADLGPLVAGGTLRATVRFDELRNADVIIICVPTPLNRSRDPDMTHIIAAADAIAKYLRRGQLIILESTTYPGTTDEVIRPLFEKSGLRAGRDFFLCFSPERVDPGNPDFKTKDISKVVGGVTERCGALGALLYGQITPHVVKVKTARNAEMAKLLENTFRIVNIGLINELAVAAKNLNVDIWEVIDAAKSKPFGFMPFYPGPGIGGHCIGIDPLYLSWKARAQGTDLHFIELARQVNAEMPDHVVSQVVYALNLSRRKAISLSRILILGVAYKRDVADYRESPALAIIEKLKRLGARVCYHDPFVPALHSEDVRLKSVPLSLSVIQSSDLILIVTDHSCIDYERIVRHGRVIFDTRNALKNIRSKKIVRL
jgi:UDP-N-acetyl-D-glucosamine dehydrogenase